MLQRNKRKVLNNTMEKGKKTERILSIYTRLKNGEVINKEKESVKYGVDTRTIQRNISDIRNFLHNQRVENGEEQEVPRLL